MHSFIRAAASVSLPLLAVSLAALPVIAQSGQNPPPQPPPSISDERGWRDDGRSRPRDAQRRRRIAGSDRGGRGGRERQAADARDRRGEGGGCRRGADSHGRLQRVPRVRAGDRARARA